MDIKSDKKDTEFLLFTINSQSQYEHNIMLYYVIHISEYNIMYILYQ